MDYMDQLSQDFQRVISRDLKGRDLAAAMLASDEVKDYFMMPAWGPENYLMDGEISSAQAFKYWDSRLRNMASPEVYAALQKTGFYKKLKLGSRRFSSKYAKVEISGKLKKDIYEADLELASDLFAVGEQDEDEGYVGEEGFILRTFDDPSVGIFGIEIADFVPSINQYTIDEQGLKDYAEASSEALDEPPEYFEIEVRDLVERIAQELGIDNKVDRIASSRFVAEDVRGLGRKPYPEDSGKWVIKNDAGDHWSNEIGWVDTDYDTFSDEEKQSLQLPVEGKWVRANLRDLKELNKILSACDRRTSSVAEKAEMGLKFAKEMLKLDLDRDDYREARKLCLSFKRYL